MLIVSKSSTEIVKLKAQLQKEFEMKDFGEAEKILDMEIIYDNVTGIVWITQKQYLKNILTCFGMDENTKSVSTPLAPYFKLCVELSPSTDEEKKYMAEMWLKFERNHREDKIFFIECVNSNYTGDLDKRQSTTEYLFTMTSGPISWRSTLQSTVAFFTTEAEYMVVG